MAELRDAMLELRLDPKRAEATLKRIEDRARTLGRGVSGEPVEIAGAPRTAATTRAGKERDPKERSRTFETAVAARVAAGQSRLRAGVSRARGLAASAAGPARFGAGLAAGRMLAGGGGLAALAVAAGATIAAAPQLTGLAEGVSGRELGDDLIEVKAQIQDLFSRVAAVKAATDQTGEMLRLGALTGRPLSPAEAASIAVGQGRITYAETELRKAKERIEGRATGRGYGQLGAAVAEQASRSVTEDLGRLFDRFFGSGR